jgi:hypothetical protein
VRAATKARKLEDAFIGTPVRVLDTALVRILNSLLEHKTFGPNTVDDPLLAKVSGGRNFIKVIIDRSTQILPEW